MFDDKIINLSMIKLMKFCEEHNYLICYGTGRFANTIYAALRHKHIFIENCLITGEVPEQTYFMDNVPVYSIRDYIVDQKNIYGVILALQEIFHNSVINEIKKKFLGNVDILILADKEISDISTYIKTVKRNRCLLQEPQVNNWGQKYYCRRMNDLFNRYEKILIRYIDIRYFGSYVSWIYYYIKRENENNKIYYLFYPIVNDGNEEWELRGANAYLLSKLQTDGLAVLSFINIDFWRFVIKYNKEKIITDDRFWNIGWTRCFNKFAVELLRPLSKRYVVFSNKEREVAQNKLIKMGLNREFVCFAIRDSLYFTKVTKIKTDVARRSAPYRNSDINNCKLAMENLANNSLQVVRMGAMVDKKISWRNMIDYAYDYREEFMDVFLSSMCQFFVSNPSGIQALPQLFSKPLISINATILTTRNDFLLLTHRERDLVIFKKFWWKSKLRYLTFSEMLKREVDEKYHEFAAAGTFAAYDAEGIIPVENTPEEINDVVQEMVAKLNGTMVYTEEDERLQQKYFDLIDTYPMKNNFPFMWRVGAKFLRDNAWLLE